MTLDTRLYPVWLLVLSALLIGTHLLLFYYHHEIAEVHWLILQLFNLDEENNLPTWFASFLLLNNAAVLLLLSKDTEHRWHWLGLAAGFLFLSIDEVAGLHESLNTSIEIHWAIIGAALIAIIGVVFIPFLIALPRNVASGYVLSGAIFVGGAIGIELLAQDMDEETLIYAYSTALEEGMEMLGALLFLAINLARLRVRDLISFQVN